MSMSVTCLAVKRGDVLGDKNVLQQLMKCFVWLQLGVTTLYAGDYNNCILECSKYFAHIYTFAQISMPHCRS